MSQGVLKVRNTADNTWIVLGAAAAVLIPKGMVERPKFAYKDADEIYIGPGGYHHHGTKEQHVYWTSELTKSGTFAGTDWYYLYIDDSAIVTAGSDQLTASEFVWSTTEPTWNDSKRGWYNGLDRCIFAVHTTAGVIDEFWHDGGTLVTKANYTLEVTGQTPSNVWTDETLERPVFSTKVHVKVQLVYSNANTSLYWRKNGSSASPGQIVGYIDSTYSIEYCSADIFTDENGVSEWRWLGATNNSFDLVNVGWYFPEGM